MLHLLGLEVSAEASLEANLLFAAEFPSSTMEKSETVFMIRTASMKL